MNKTMKNFLVIAAVVVLVGVVFAGIGFGLGGMRSVAFTRTGMVVMDGESKDVVRINESYTKLTSININIDTAEVRLVEGDSFALEGRYNSFLQSFEVDERDGVLTIKGKNLAHGWWGVGFFDTSGNSLTLTYPKGTNFENVDIKLSLGSLEMRNLDADSLAVNLALGDFNGSALSAQTMNASLNLGSCTLRDLTVTELADFSLDSGSLQLKDSAVNNLSVKNSLGSFEYSGELKGRTKATLDLGSLTFDLTNREQELSYTIDVDLGSIRINGKEKGSHVDVSNASPTSTLDISLSLGDAKVKTR
ncbi:MAG: DUF4097 domain-containing protein [Eggerthellaceae bacterium]|jgi:hypothetical protein|nr:DUF4097 domain-containing protein [Eggerthellaceae bacterium]